ncbi:hypothetical protein G7Y89_g2523 [Cudoniella acicularis]|uniref:Uncharacterized protein n=1 Tax=Cudoniella acicularis TaxID=354080 RepID=A0A8H4RT72_9HELO|nr:hypothetical protein G7Y89_g2523 [Cudoniella acicularis]
MSTREGRFLEEQSRGTEGFSSNNVPKTTLKKRRQQRVQPDDLAYVETLPQDVEAIPVKNLESLLWNMLDISLDLNEHFLAMWTRKKRHLGFEKRLSDMRSINDCRIKETGKGPGLIERPLNIVEQPSSLKTYSQKGYVIIIAIVSIFTLLLAIIPGNVALKYFPHQLGTVQDADFWYLVQSSGVQWLFVLTIIIYIRTRNDLTFESWFWTWMFIFLAIICSAAAIPCYFYLPTEWSAVVSLVGAAA